MSALTTIPLVLRALEQQLTADLAVTVPGCQVIYGPRASKTVTKSTILTIGNVDFDRVLTTFDSPGDAYPEDEPYDITMVAECTTSGTDQHEATEGALAVFQAVLTSLQAPGVDETMGVPGVQWVRVTGRGRVVPAVDALTIKRGRSCAVPFIVRVLGVL